MALVLVLWVVTLLTVIAASFTLGMRREAETIRVMIEAAQAHAAAEAGIRFAMIALARSSDEVDWQPDGAPRQWNFGGAELSVTMDYEAGRVDINSAPMELIDGVLRQAGVDDAPLRARLVDRILDWRDVSPHQRVGGLSDADYRALGLDYGPRNAPFPALEELLLVPGVDADLFSRLQPMLTVHSRQSGVHWPAAPEDVLFALPGVDLAVVEVYVMEREHARVQGLPPPASPANALVQTGDLVSVRSVARMPSGLEQAVRVVLARETLSGREPFRVIHYRFEGSY